MEKTVQHDQATQLSGIPATGTRGLLPAAGRQCLTREKLTQHWHHYRGQVKTILRNSASLGRQLATLLSTEEAVAGVTVGTVLPELREIGQPQHIEGRQLRPSTGDLEIKASWGHLGKDGAVMPGRGKTIRRNYSKEELRSIEIGAKSRGLSLKNALALLGESTYDVFLNDYAYWKNIPERVFEYTIGGYQVIKKWLSYRERELLGRSLSKEEVREVMNMARRISAIVLLESQLNDNYQKVKQSVWKWPSKPSADTLKKRL